MALLWLSSYTASTQCLWFCFTMWVQFCLHMLQSAKIIYIRIKREIRWGQSWELWADSPFAHPWTSELVLDLNYCRSTAINTGVQLSDSSSSWQTALGLLANSVVPFIAWGRDLLPFSLIIKLTFFASKSVWEFSFLSILLSIPLSFS